MGVLYVGRASVTIQQLLGEWHYFVNNFYYNYKKEIINK